MADETNRQLAIALAQVRGAAIASEASAQIQTISANAAGQEGAIEAEGSNDATARIGVANAEAAATEQIGACQAQAVNAESEAQASSLVAESAAQVGAITGVAGAEADATIASAGSEAAAVAGEAGARASADSAIAGVNAGATAAEVGSQAAQIASDASSAAEEAAGVAAARAAAAREAAGSQAAADTAVAGSDAGAATAAAGYSAGATTSAAASEASATTSAANAGAAAETYAASQEAAGVKLEASSQSRLIQSGAKQDFDAALQVANNHASAAEYAADDQYQEQVVHEDAEDRRLDIKLTYADEKFNEVFPVAEQAIAASGNLTAPATIGLMTPWPSIPMPIPFTPRLVQMQANLAYARSDQEVASNYREALADVSGRGFSSNSPYIDAVRATLVGRGLRQSALGAAQARIGALQANATTLLSLQKLRGQDFIDQNQVAVQSEANQVERQVGLIDGVASIVAGLL